MNQPECVGRLAMSVARFPTRLMNENLFPEH